MLLVQEYLKTHTLDQLREEHGVKHSFSKDQTLVSLNYEQIEAKEGDPIACQCRGLVLANKNGEKINPDNFKDTVIASYGFNRFFNEGQVNASVNYNDKNLKVYEKLDGTCIFLYFHNGWKTATRSVPLADIMIDNFNDHDFSSLFKKALQDTIKISFEEYVSTLDKDVTYIFELTTPRNIIVVKHKDYSVTLLGARNKITLQEYDVDQITNLVPKVKSYNLSNLKDIIDFVNSQDGSEHEGVVVRDSSFKRVKIKNPSYIALNKIKDSIAKSERSLVELVLLQKEDDVIPYLEQSLVEKINSFKDKFSKLVKRVDLKYEEYIKETDLHPYSKQVRKKVFAGFVTTREDWIDPFFKMYDGKCKSAMEYVMSKKHPVTGWGDSFIDHLIEVCK